MPRLSSSISKSLIDEAVRFHGHLGPFLVLGLKAGMFANKVLGKSHFDTKVTVETEPFPPCSCIVDGIQITTGCTMGKRNIELKNGDSLTVTFRKNNHELKLSLKTDILKQLMKIPSKEESKKAALNLVDAHVTDLFDIEAPRNA